MKFMNSVKQLIMQFWKFCKNFFDSEKESPQDQGRHITEQVEKTQTTNQDQPQPVSHPQSPRPKRSAQTFEARLDQELRYKKVHNVSITPIPSPGVIIHTDMYDHHQHAIDIYGINEGQFKIRITDQNNILNYVEQKHPELELDEAMLNQTGIFINHEFPESLYLDSDLDHFAKDLKTFIKVSTMLID